MLSSTAIPLGENVCSSCSWRDRRPPLETLSACRRDRNSVTQGFPVAFGKTLTLIPDSGVHKLLPFCFVSMPTFQQSLRIPLCRTVTEWSVSGDSCHCWSGRPCSSQPCHSQSGLLSFWPHVSQVQLLFSGLVNITQMREQYSIATHVFLMFPG